MSLSFTLSAYVRRLDHIGVPTDLLENHVLLPSQLHDARLNRYARSPEHDLRYARSPEHDLTFAIFEDAIYCLVAYQDTHQPRLRTIYEEARNWVLASDPEAIRQLFSFENCCAILGYESSGLRRHLAPYLQPLPPTHSPVVLPLSTGADKSQTASRRAKTILSRKRHGKRLPHITPMT